MDVTMISAGLAWAVPVKPDTLAWHLEAYERSLPKLHALRLCHRFGKGPKVHVTKLPFEILQMIEDSVLDQDRRTYQYRFRGSEWEEAFYHFESRCQPIDHFEDPYEMFLNDAFEFDEVCEDCLSDDTLDDECAKCEDLRTQEMNEWICEGDMDWRYDRCETMGSRWKTMIDQTGNGKFVKFDKLLRKHFGLEAFFAHTRKARSDTAPWTNHSNHHWHDEEELETTICYLTLPRVAAEEQTYGISDSEVGGGGPISVSGAQSSFVMVPKTANRDAMLKQFKRALRELKLKPYIHPSQLTRTVTAEASKGLAQSTQDAVDGTATQSQQQQDLTKIEWPQLVMLTKISSTW